MKAAAGSGLAGLICLSRLVRVLLSPAPKAPPRAERANGPCVMASLRNLAITILRMGGHRSTASAIVRTSA
jgi:hypothetical protein